MHSERQRLTERDRDNYICIPDRDNYICICMFINMYMYVYTYMYNCVFYIHTYGVRHPHIHRCTPRYPTLLPAHLSRKSPSPTPLTDPCPSPAPVQKGVERRGVALCCHVLRVSMTWTDRQGAINFQICFT